MDEVAVEPEHVVVPLARDRLQHDIAHAGDLGEGAPLPPLAASRESGMTVIGIEAKQGGEED